MRMSTEIPKQERVQPKGNWMQLTIAPLVAEKLDCDKPLPGAGTDPRPLRSFVGAAGPTGLADDDSA